jgi:hypothetical protein
MQQMPPAQQLPPAQQVPQAHPVEPAQAQPVEPVQPLYVPPVQPVLVRRAPRVRVQAAPRANTDGWQGSIGWRMTFIRSAGFDPFSENDLLSQISFGFQRVLARRDALAFAAGAAADFGAGDATARGAPSHMSLWRFTAVAEGRYRFWEHGYGFLRVAPGFLHGSAEVQDSSAPTLGPLTDDFDGLAADASGGAALRVSGSTTPVAAWLSAEGGYGWAASHHLRLAPSASAQDQAKLAPVDLGNIDPRGVFMRLSLLITY